MRHTYATEMLRAGVTFPALMKLLGHTSADMTMQYLDSHCRISSGNFVWLAKNPGILFHSPRPFRLSSPRSRWANRFFARCPTSTRNVSPGTTRRRLSPSPRPALQSPHQNSYRSAQTPNALKTGRDWPVMSENRTSAWRLSQPDYSPKVA